MSKDLRPHAPIAIRFQHDLKINGKGERTQQSYVRMLRKFSEFRGADPDSAAEEDLRCYFLLGQESQLPSPCSLLGSRGGDQPGWPILASKPKPFLCSRACGLEGVSGQVPSPDEASLPTGSDTEMRLEESLVGQLASRRRRTRGFALLSAVCVSSCHR